MEELVTINGSTMLVRAERVLSAGVDDEFVLMNVDDGRFYALDDIGLRVWDLIETPRAFGDVCGQVLAEYDVEAETCETALRALIEKLRNARLVEQVAS
jgi:hypothetical protein